MEPKVTIEDNEDLPAKVDAELEKKNKRSAARRLLKFGSISTILSHFGGKMSDLLGHFGAGSFSHQIATEGYIKPSWDVNPKIATQMDAMAAKLKPSTVHKRNADENSISSLKLKMRVSRKVVRYRLAQNAQ